MCPHIYVERSIKSTRRFVTWFHLGYVARRRWTLAELPIHFGSNEH